MDYKGYEIQENKSDGIVIIKNIRDFNPTHTFECGQCFRWIRESDGSYTGVVRDLAVNVTFDGKDMLIGNCTIDDFINVWYQYFDLERDYSEIKKELSKKDDIMRKAVEFGSGIRILRQDLWEMIISFIISANNRIPMIMKIINNLSEMYGNKIILGDKICYTFPDINKITNENIDNIRICKAGFRCKYIFNASMMVKNKEIDIDKLHNVDTDEARRILRKLPGAGPKVTDCVLLYSGVKYDVFPADIWIKRAVEKLYFHHPASINEIQKFAKNYFGDLAGFAQQYLFYYARENKIVD